MMRKSTTALLLAAVAFVAAGCERPPPTSKQQGYRGLGMVQVDNPRTVEALRQRDVVPAAQDPVKPGGPLATTEYKNVKVLTDVSVDEFNRLMLAMTEWVSPEQGCAYCHNVENLADDNTYQKIVARRMLEMTRHINSQWRTHVADTGVTCYTCHRGKPVPDKIWFDAVPGARDGSLVGNRAGQNAPSTTVGLTSLPNDPLQALREYAGEIRVAGTQALPTGGGAAMQSTEATYGLMMHMSEATGLNCTACHNSRSFSDWGQSSPQRATAWHGIRMARDLNAKYLEPLKASYPAERLGPTGDAPKVSCATCHQGVSKPLGGANMLKDYRELGPRTK